MIEALLDIANSTEKQVRTKSFPADESPLERMSDIETSLAILRGFAEDVAAGETDYPEDMVEALKWATAVLSMTAGLTATKVIPPIFKALTSDKGVSFTGGAAMVPAFCEDMERRIDSRIAEASQDGVVGTPLVDAGDDDVPF
jgi:hypothetical protein